MKATGIVRRIDDLGRVVIPKEIRRTMRIREGSPLEIFIDRDGGVIFRKYSPLGELSSFAGDSCSAVYSATGIFCAVTDGESVIAYSGQGKKDVIERSISNDCRKVFDDRRPYTADGREVRLCDGLPLSLACAYPIISEGDNQGMIALLDTPQKTVTDSDNMLIKSFSFFLGRQLES